MAVARAPAVRAALHAGPSARRRRLRPAARSADRASSRGWRARSGCRPPRRGDDAAAYANLPDPRTAPRRVRRPTASDAACGPPFVADVARARAAAGARRRRRRTTRRDRRDRRAVRARARIVAAARLCGVGRARRRRVPRLTGELAWARASLAAATAYNEDLQARRAERRPTTRTCARRSTARRRSWSPPIRPRAAARARCRPDVVAQHRTRRDVDAADARAIGDPGAGRRRARGLPPARVDARNSRNPETCPARACPIPRRPGPKCYNCIPLNRRRLPRVFHPECRPAHGGGRSPRAASHGALRSRDSPVPSGAGRCPRPPPICAPSSNHALSPILCVRGDGVLNERTDA